MFLLKSSAARGALCEAFGSRINQVLLWLVTFLLLTPSSARLAVSICVSFPWAQFRLKGQNVLGIWAGEKNQCPEAFFLHQTSFFGHFPSYYFSVYTWGKKFRCSLQSQFEATHPFRSFLCMSGKNRAGRTRPDFLWFWRQLVHRSWAGKSAIMCVWYLGWKSCVSWGFLHGKWLTAGFWPQLNQRALKKGLDISIPTTSCTPKKSKDIVPLDHHLLWPWLW